MKAHTLSRLLSSLYNSPHLATQPVFDTVESYLISRNQVGLHQVDFLKFDETEKKKPAPSFDSGAGIGILSVQGALTYRPVEGLCGATGCSYESLLSDAQEMLDAGVKTLVMDVDSGGGQGYGAFECATELRKMVDEAGAKLFAYNDGYMASAAYALGCVADVVVSNPYAETGSIGVLIGLVNDSKRLEQEGYSRQFITAGASKIPFAPDGSFREGFIEDLQAKVDALYAEFVGHVADNTGLDAEVIRKTEAKMFSAKDALSLGLINKIMTRSEFIAYVVDEHKGTY